jgi:hypothetical protein
MPTIFAEAVRRPFDERETPWTLHKSARVVSKSLGPASGLGKYIKDFAKQHGLDLNDLKGDRYKTSSCN